ncbi:NAD(P)/FAD-dependent oxidoreductase [Jeotgalibacillus sp. JSM ZJ347]|uniref:NAD(P)/FAD-dependent oxidoreductase n=1 Tax=Jeotgalibacillus sp. JSM ZJ347 TaxID=3342117 RepID=UPI0035A8DE39
MKIGVIGGGISGLIAARKLQSEGHEVEVIEKSRSVGGRLATRRIGEGQADHGAVYFTVRDEAFDLEVQEWVLAGVVKKWAADPHPKYIGTNGMNKLAKFLAEPLHVHLNEKIVNVTATEEGMTLTGSACYEYDAVLLTAPLPQAMELLEASDILLTEEDKKLQSYIFEPAFVGLIELAHNVPTGEYGLLDQNLPDEVLKIVNNFEKGISKNPILSIYMTGDWSEKWYERENEAIAEIERLLSQELGELKVASKQLKRWRYAQAKQVFEAPFYKLSDQPVWLCGDVFLRPDDPSGNTRVESAYWSGLKAAGNLLDNLRR